MHFNRLLKERRKNRLEAWGMLLGSAGMFLCGGLSLSVILLTHVHLPTSLPSNVAVIGLLMLATMLLAGATIFVLSIRDLRRAAKPVASQEVEQNRQQERAELLWRAQGNIPFSHRRPAIIIEIVVACLYTVFGLSFVAVPLDTPAWLNIPVAVLFWLGVPALLVDAFYFRPRAAKRMARVSQRALSTRLTLGELTEGDAQNESKEEGE
jgi:hypothetical protein